VRRLLSREELILVKRLRKLITLTPTYSIFLGIYLIYLVATPVYVVDGVVKGYVAMTHHELLFYGASVRYDTFLSLSFLSLSILVLGMYLVFAGASTHYLFFSGRDFSTGVKWLFGGALSTLASLGLTSALISKLAATTALLSMNLNQVTSAGILYLGTSRVFPIYPACYLLSPLVLIPATLTYVILATATYLHEVMVEELRLARYPPFREIKYRIVGS
jgi:hypothetical protein